MKFTLIEQKEKYSFTEIRPETKSHVFNKLDKVKNAIFLAGPCPRDPKEKDEWRDACKTILNELKFDGIVLNPTNPYYDTEDKDHLIKQTEWEFEAMKKASAIIFWVERSEAHPAYTTNIEFGDWYDKTGVFVGWTAKAIKNRYLQVRLDKIGKKRYGSLETLCKAVLKDLNREPKKWFLSDTHLGQERTLTLSKRPFLSVQDMDYEIISNWNKNIRMNDEVYFLGDFGASFDYLNFLNYGKLHFVLGNYERQNAEKKDITADSIKALKKFKDVFVYDKRGDCKVTLSNKKEIICVHEPIDPNGVTDFTDRLCAYGHIHGRQFYKRNGTDVGVDIHNYSPMDEEELLWRLNAIQYLDQNVWCADVK